MGFGFIEVGTVTPQAQPGNPKPRMFRAAAGASADQPAGLQQRRPRRLHRQRAARQTFRAAGGIARPEHRQERRHADRARRRRLPARACAASTRMPTTSPSTSRARTRRTCARCRATSSCDGCSACSCGRRAELARAARRTMPLFVKIAPDLDEEQIKVIAATLQRHGIDGVIATNTTVARDGVHHLPQRPGNRRPVGRAAAGRQQPRHPPAARRTRQGATRSSASAA